MVETCKVSVAEKNSEASDWVKLTMPAHRTDVRTLSFSSDNTAILSGSAETVKVWNRYIKGFRLSAHYNVVPQDCFHC